MGIGHGWEHGRIGAGARFVDPRVLQRIGNLEFIARGVVEGFLQGLHRSPFLGQSVDFAEHRPYSPGDDLRRVDWKAYARTGRYYVREFEAETNANVTVLLDCSNSMAFGNEVTKFDYARFLGACLAFLSRRQGDRVGIFTFDRKVRDVVPCSARHLERVLLAIDRARPSSAGNLVEGLRDIASRQKKGGIMVLISDLYEDPSLLRGPMALLREAGNDVTVFQLLDPAERSFPYEGSLTLEDMETGEALPISPASLRAEYRERVTQHVAAMSRVLAGAGADHILVDTSTPLDQALFDYLLARRYQKRSGRWASRS